MPRHDERHGRRVLAIWLPRWPVQRRLLERPELRGVPVFVSSRGRRGTLTVVSWAWATPPRVASARQEAERSRGTPIRPGMTLAEAMAVLALSHGSRACHVAVVDDDDPVTDRTTLVQVARWCRRFSPTCGLEAPEPPRGTASATGESPRPECIHLDVTGTAGFFGGEESLVRTVVWTLAARGLHARAAIADTPSAARIAARHTDLLPCPPVERALRDRPHAGRSSVPRPAVDSGSPPAPPTDVPAVERLPRSRLWWKPAQRRRRWVVVPPGEAASVLADLPVSALQLDRDTLSLLQELGIESVGAALRLPVDRLAARFPPQVGRCLARFRGTLAEPWGRLTGRPAGVRDGRACHPLEADAASADDDLPRAVHAFDAPVAFDDLGEPAILAVIERLLQACVAPLAARGEGVLSLQVRLDAGTGRVPTVIDVGLFRPSCTTTHLVDLVRLRLGRCSPPGELSAIAVEVVAAGAALCRQRSLFTADMAAGAGDTPESQAVAVGMLLDRLCGRLGRSAVFVPRAVADPQPEHAWVASCPTERMPAATATTIGSGMTPRSRGWGGPIGGRRPIWMPPRPVPLERSGRVTPGPGPAGPASATALLAGSPSERIGDAPDAPPACFWWNDRWHHVAHAHGPERIETAWWRGPTVRRDYYVVETVSGERFWLFRSRREGHWFLHGIFA